MTSESKNTSRYSRQTILREVGASGQSKLQSASILVVGAGGLGSPALLYLAASGVGRIGIVDDDKVDISNLQRQILFSENDCEKSKAETARYKLEELNSEATILHHKTFLTPDNALEIISQYDLVIDATDRFTATYLINDVCTSLSIPWIYGAISKFEGRLATFLPGSKNRRPCYRCLYPKAPTTNIGSCSDNGVIGAVAGIVGSYQALEAIKTILGLNYHDASKLLTIDSLSNNNFSIEIPPRADCQLCGSLDMGASRDDKLKNLKNILKRFNQEYMETCQMSPINANDFATEEDLRNAEQFIDVREADEFDDAHIDGAFLMPLSTLAQESTPKGQLDAKTVVHCRAGGRAQTAFPLLKALGYTNLKVYAGTFDSIITTLYDSED